MLKSLARTPIFFSLISLLLIITLFSIYFFRNDFSVLASQLLKRNDADLQRWQQWARHYRRLFGMLRSGERIGLQIEGFQSSGVLLEKTKNDVIARRSLFLRWEKPGVILIFGPQTAEELLASVSKRKPEDIWQMVKERLYTRGISIWNDPDIGRLQEGGYLAFMRAIDTRPRNLDWPTVKRILEEK